MTVRWLTAFHDRPAATFDAATRFWLAITGSELSPRRGGHDEFATLIPPDGEAIPDPAARTLVDQFCIDIPPDGFERECAFWSALTGWERRPGLLPAFSYLVRPDHVPLRSLFQRLDDARDGPASAPLDLSSFDRDTAADWHQELGAVRQQRHEYWTTMTDPSGLPYCITRRNPDTGLLDSPA